MSGPCRGKKKASYVARKIGSWEKCVESCKEALACSAALCQPHLATEMKSLRAWHVKGEKSIRPLAWNPTRAGRMPGDKRPISHESSSEPRSSAKSGVQPVETIEAMYTAVTKHAGTKQPNMADEEHLCTRQPWRGDFLQRLT